MSEDPYLRMSSLEAAAGWVPGFVPVQPGLEEHVPIEDPLEAFEAVLLKALQFRTCFVEFSGGRDSSAVLAAACQVARREGLALPVPLTRVFPEAPTAREGDWPERVIRHLGLKEWIRLEIRDELDLLGPTAIEGIRQHGLLWPVTVHTKPMTFEQARGGALVSGEGGDEVFGRRRITPVTMLLAGIRPRSLGLKFSLAALSPKLIRKRYAESSVRKSVGSWLTPLAANAHTESVVADELGEPIVWAESVRALSRRRGWIMGKHNLSVRAKQHDVEYFHPLLDERFIEAFVRRRPILGYPNRTTAMQAIFGSLLPAEVLARSTKARFNSPYFHDYCRAFARDWSGEGVDPELVHVEELKRVWNGDLPHAQSLPLLHQAWLAVSGIASSLRATTPNGGLSVVRDPSLNP
ncbi:MAG TPA: asparagine synthase-related protein [Acidimicrobiia bacterium]|nr:asparagine synthase-related protein [Acidimicrobiia bacterium]